MILGAFLHDIGHLVGKDKNLEDMVTDGVIIGTQNHDKVGENFLRDLGRYFLGQTTMNVLSLYLISLRYKISACCAHEY